VVGANSKIAGVLIIAVAGVGACGQDSRESSGGEAPPGGSDERAADDRAAVLDVMDAARSAVLAGDAETACGLLTPHARDRVLGFQVDFLPTGSPIPSKRPGVPQTCEQMMRAQLQDDRGPDVAPSWSRDLEAAEFEVTAQAGDEARVRLKVPEAYGPSVKFRLIRTVHGWRIDDSDAVPSGY
jgi:hypothetical protein